MVLIVRRKRGFAPLSYGACAPRTGRVSRTPCKVVWGTWRYAPYPYDTLGWKLLYNKRLSVDRLFSRLKGYRKLDALRTRGLPKVWLHVAQQPPCSLLRNSYVRKDVNSVITCH